MRGIEDLIIQKYETKEYKLKDIICFSVDRAAGKTYKQHFTVNQLCTLTTNNKYLMVADVESIVNKLPDSDRMCFRKAPNFFSARMKSIRV